MIKINATTKTTYIHERYVTLFNIINYTYVYIRNKRLKYFYNRLSIVHIVLCYKKKKTYYNY